MIATSKSKGFTLIELMVALLIGAITLAGVLQISAANKSAARIQDSLSQLQENGRFALEFITRDLRMAGYQGCLSKLTQLELNDNDNNFSYTSVLQADTFYDFSISLQGYNSGSSVHANITSQIGTPLSGKDLITLHLAEESGVTITQFEECPNSACQDRIRLNQGGDLQKKDLIAVSDCQTLAIMQISNNPQNGPWHRS